MRTIAWSSLGMLFLLACGSDPESSTADPARAPGSLDASPPTADAPSTIDAQADRSTSPERAPEDALSYGVSPDQDHELRLLEGDSMSMWTAALRLSNEFRSSDNVALVFPEEYRSGDEVSRWFSDKFPSGDRVKLHGVLATTKWPEIGAIVTLGQGAICTATMLGARVVVTAAHCVDCSTTTNVYGHWFAVYQDDGTVLLYKLENVVSRYPNDCTTKPPPPEQDIALAVISDTHVRTKLPGQVRRVAPGRIDARNVTLVGAGCVSPDTSKGRGVRRQLTGVWQAFADRFVVCHGDSGGPVLDRNGDVVGLITGYYEESKAGAFAPMSGDNLAWVQAQLARLK